MPASDSQPDTRSRRVEGLKLLFGGGLVRQLGAQLYPSATASVAELISNAWDANATTVWVTMPFGDWEDGEITVVDDGHGMTFVEARDLYLRVGQDRRERGQRTEDLKRLAHGRKGIGKLAAFGTGRLLEVKSHRQGAQSVAFGLDYDEIRELPPGAAYDVLKSTDEQGLVNPDGQPLAHGTRVRLTRLRLKRRLDAETFVHSMSRRFVLSDHEMQVFINRRKLERYALKLQYRFPQDGVPDGATAERDWVKENIDGGKEVRWWMGFTPKPLNAEGEQGVSIVSRGKLVQAPFIFRRFQGTEGQIGQEYLVGEVQADWLDPENPEEPDDSEADVITSNRDALQLEDERLEPFVDWGRRRVAWALSRRVALRKESNDRTLSDKAAVQQAMRAFPASQRPALRRIATSLLELDVSDDVLVDVLHRVDDVRADQVIRQALDRVEEGDDLDPRAVWREARHLADVDARTLSQILRSRILLLERLLQHEPPVVVDLTDALLASPWLLGADWEGATGTDGGPVVRLRGRDEAQTWTVDVAALAAPAADGDQLIERLERSLGEHHRWVTIVDSRVTQDG